MPITDEVTARVRDRLAMVKHLIEMNHPLAVPEKAGPTKDKDGRHDGGWLHEYAQLDSLVTYLLLTCFDVLGQPSDWTPFGFWVERSAYASERQDALRMHADADPVAAARALHDHYNTLYGVRSSFMHFIDGVLNDDARKQLLASVNLIRFEPEPVGIIDDDSERKRVLYRLRNEFTHTARLWGAPRQEDGSRLAPATPERSGLPGHHLFTENGLLCMVHDWPFKLYEAVASAVGDAIPDFDVKYTVMLTLKTGRHVSIENVRRSEFEDRDRMAKLFQRLEGEMKRFLEERGETPP